jgi:hypothetical protein
MMSLDEIREAMQDRRLRVLADKTGISYPTLLTVRDNLRANPRHDILKKLSDYFTSKEVS